MTTSLSRRVSIFLVLGLICLLLLGKIAVDHLTSQINFPRPITLNTLPTTNAIGLSNVIKLQEHEGKLSLTHDARALDDWIKYLKDHPESRITLSMAIGNSVVSDGGHQVASLVQLLSNSGIDPHRVRLIESPATELGVENGLKTSTFNDVVVVEIKLE